MSIEPGSNPNQPGRYKGRDLPPTSDRTSRANVLLRGGEPKPTGSKMGRFNWASCPDPDFREMWGKRIAWSAAMLTGLWGLCATYDPIDRLADMIALDPDPQAEIDTETLASRSLSSGP